MTTTKRKYSCKNCDGRVTKPPCEKGGSAGLGGWRCDNCGPTKVKVELVK